VIIGGWRGPGWRIVDAVPGNARQVRDWIRSAITSICPLSAPGPPSGRLSEPPGGAFCHHDRLRLVSG
jgi:hypothetical protein